MLDEPRNAASEAAAVMTDLMRDVSRFDEVLAMVADDFVQHDRRKLVGSPGVDKTAWGEIAEFLISVTGLASRDREVLAVRGDRLVLSRIVDHYGDGSTREFIALGDFDGDPVRVRRTVMFDPDDLDAALAELDRLHDEIAGAVAEPAGRPGDDDGQPAG